MATSSSRQTPPPGSEEPAESAFRHHHALLVGLSRYHFEDRVEGRFRRIYRADDDAQRLRDVLVTAGYSASQVSCLRNEEADYDAVRRELERLARVIDRADLIVLFWAGHGAGVDGRNLLLPYKADPDRLDATCLTVNEIADLAARFNTANIALLLDTCHAAPDYNGFIHPEWSAVPPRLVDRVVLFAGASTQLASESARGGLLAQCLEEGLQDHPGALADGRSLVRTQALGGYLQWRLAERARNLPFDDPEGRAFPQLPFIHARYDRNPPIGRNLRMHVTKRLDEEGLPWPIDTLARRVAKRSWPAP